MNRPHAIFCLWEVIRDLLVKNDEGFYNDSYGKLWRLVETYGVDQDGYAIGQTKHASGGRHSFQDWMNRKCWYDKATKKVVYECPEGQDEDDNDWEGITGRVVTGWSMESGVFLAAFNPPGEHRWLGMDFLKVVQTSDRWAQFIHDGHTLYLGTARAAEKLLWPVIPPKADGPKKRKK